MIEVVAALAPVFGVIVLGFILRRRQVIPDVFWEPAERTTFYLFFPSLLIANTAKAELEGLQMADLAAVSFGGILLIIAVTYGLRRVLRLDGPAFTSLIQGSVRPNVYVAIAGAAALYGDEGLTVVSLCVAMVVPFVNALSVLAMVRYAGDPSRPTGWRQTVAPVLKNPLIIACLTGLLLNLTGIGLPPLIGPLMEILGRAALPVGLLAVGAGLDLGAVRSAGPVVATATALKLVALPLVTLALCLALGTDEVARAVAVLYAAVPGSASAYVMARQMGGDAPIMAGAIAATTLFAAITMPLIMALVI